MSFGTSSGQVPRYTSLQIQTATATVPIPLCYGKVRTAPNLIWYGDFTSKDAGKGMGKGFGSPQAYDYHASLIMALSEGPINGIFAAWVNNSKTSNWASLGFTLFVGTRPFQAPWSYLVTKHPTQADGYPGVAYLAAANYDLGESPTTPSHNFEIGALLYDTAGLGTGDADIAEVANDFLTVDLYGVLFPSSAIDSASLFSGPNAHTTGDNALQTWCRAMGWGISAALTSQEPASTILQRWADIANCALVWTGSALKFIPWADQPVTGNTYVFVPSFPSIYTLTDADFQHEDGQDPVILQRMDPADAFNSYVFSCTDRSNDYANAPATWQDQGLIDQFGLRPNSTIQALEVCSVAMATQMVQIYGQRIAYTRNKYTFHTGPEYCLAEPMDCLTLVDAVFGTFSVLIEEVAEQDDGSLEFTVQEFPGTTGTAPANAAQSVSNTPQNALVDPGPVNPPVIFEPDATLSAGVPQVWIAASGGVGGVNNPDWGSADVWIGTDGVNFTNVGVLAPSAQQGLLTAGLPAYGGANPDTVNTLAVDLAESNGSLVSVSSTNAAGGANLAYVDGEILTFETATLVSGNAYHLTNLYRGLGGTTAASHSSGTKFALLDASVFKYNLPPGFIGQTLHVKLQSRNIYGGAPQDLSTCTDYTYMIAGTGYTSQPPGSIFVSGPPGAPSGFTATPAAGANVLAWTAPGSGGTVAEYEIWAIHGSSGPFSSATQIGSTTSTGWVHTGLPGLDTWRYWVVAVNSAGSSAPAGPANSTTLNAGGGTTTHFGSGAPVTLFSEGDLYFDTSTAPYTEWVQHSGAWELAGGSGLPKNFAFFAEGLLAPNELLAEWEMPETLVIDDTNATTFFNTNWPATANTDLPLKALIAGVWTLIGNLHLPASATSGSLVISSNPYTLPAHTRLQLLAPASPDATAADYYGLIQGT